MFAGSRGMPAAHFICRHRQGDPAEPQPSRGLANIWGICPSMFLEYGAPPMTLRSTPFAYCKLLGFSDSQYIHDIPGDHSTPSPKDLPLDRILNIQLPKFLGRDTAIDL